MSFSEREERVRRKLFAYHKRELNTPDWIGFECTPLMNAMEKAANDGKFSESRLRNLIFSPELEAYWLDLKEQMTSYELHRFCEKLVNIVDCSQVYSERLRASFVKNEIVLPIAKLASLLAEHLKKYSAPCPYDPDLLELSMEDMPEEEVGLHFERLFQPLAAVSKRIRQTDKILKEIIPLPYDLISELTEIAHRAETFKVRPEFLSDSPFVTTRDVATPNRDAIFFLRAVSVYFQKNLGQYLDETVASLTNVAFDLSGIDQGFDAEKVRSYTKRGYRTLKN